MSFGSRRSSPIPHPQASVCLDGVAVRLEPMSWSHLAALTAAGSDESLWTWTPTPAHTPESMREFVEEAMRQVERGTAIPFVTIEKTANQVVGSTRFANIDWSNRRAEIGWTWIARPWQRTRVNTEAKYLMLRYAFESLGMMRVELKTDALNEASRAAILRLGAKEEGTFRKHLITKSGRVRDTVWFSIIDDEWPTVKARLEEKLASA